MFPSLFFRFSIFVKFSCFAGKEQQRAGYLDFIDFGVRMYDPALARWFVLDRIRRKIPLDRFAGILGQSGKKRGIQGAGYRQRTATDRKFFGWSWTATGLGCF